MQTNVKAQKSKHKLQDTKDKRTNVQNQKSDRKYDKEQTKRSYKILNGTTLQNTYPTQNTYQTQKAATTCSMNYLSISTARSLSMCAMVCKCRWRACIRCCSFFCLTHGASAHSNTERLEVRVRCHECKRTGKTVGTATSKHAQVSRPTLNTKGKHAGLCNNCRQWSNTKTTKLPKS